MKHSIWNRSWLVETTRCYGGDAPAPTTGESTAQMLYGYQQGLPGISQVANEQILPNELAQLNAAKAVSPGWADLTSQIYSQYAPGLNKVGADINAANAMSQAQSDANILKGPGRDIAAQSLEVAKINDPEYYATRAAMAKQLPDLLTGKLTGGEEEAIQRGIDRQNVNMGVGDRQSTAQLASNASQYGGAVHDRMTQALSLATNALPTFKSGVDTGAQVLGRPTTANSGAAQFNTPQQGQLGGQQSQLSNSLLGQIGDTQRTAMGINANRRDALDRSSQVMSSLPNIS